MNEKSNYNYIQYSGYIKKFFPDNSYSKLKDKPI